MDAPHFTWVGLVSAKGGGVLAGLTHVDLLILIRQGNHTIFNLRIMDPGLRGDDKEISNSIAAYVIPAQAGIH